MKKFVEYINNNVLVRVASLNSASVITRIIAGFLTSKAIALFVGAEGLALIGNFRNFVGTLQSFSILGLYNGVVKYVAEFKNNTKELSKMLSTAYYMGFMSTVLCGFLCYFFSNEINNYLFPTYNDYAYIIRIFALALPFYSLNMFTYSILNGFSKFKILIIINIIGQILAASITLLLIYQERIDGALISVAISESLIFLITLVGISNQRSLAPLLKLSHFRLDFVKKLSSFSIMKIFSAMALPLVAIAIRTYLIDHVGFKEAGFWEAMNRISKYYLMFISSLMSLYILPRFSEINTIKEFRTEVFNFYKTVLPIFGLGLLAIYLMRHILIAVIFSSEFKPVESLFLWQLLGDFINVLSIVIAYQFLAKNMVWHYLIVEAFSVSILYISSILFVDIFGVQGAVIGHFVTQVLHFALILFIFNHSLFGVLPEEELLQDDNEDLDHEND
ncbi:O-antigen translocase [Mangrovimonas futianensis]|uniref:O-antigen translocase n=1 Tax=Mangrovimonas futianensis TaxID=2895523 RepID=UPI001E597C6A|nr:O-antigen translocase [Mangrovimonas futianensis]MCF1421213.1 O-antigen translocase [Mangrovimonas futianensis]